MSNEIDSNMLLTSLLYCYGGFIQNEENRIVIGQGANRKGAIQALEVMRDIYRNGMSDEVFAWTRGVEQPGVPRRAGLGGPERDLDRPLGGGLREPGARPTTRGSPRSRAAP